MSVAGSLLERLAPTPVQGARAEIGRVWLAKYGMPNRREEAWLYTPLDEILAALQAAQPAVSGSELVDVAFVDRVAGNHGGPRLVFVNGVFAPDVSSIDGNLSGLWLGDADGLRPKRRPDASPPKDVPVDGFHALNWAAGRDVAGVLVDPDVDVSLPVHVVHLTVPGEVSTAVHPRTVVRVGRGSRVHVIETYAGTEGRSITNASTRIIAGEDAVVTYHRVMAGPAGSIHVGRTGIEQGVRSEVKAASFIAGGDIVRNAIDVRLSGAGARVDLDGLYLPTGRQRHDNVIKVDHVASHCVSTQRFKGVVADHGRGSFSGHVVVQHGTVGTDAKQSNPNLVLAPTAQADTRPWLEIFADDVKCTHGATVGRLDKEALFYLRSRGISLEQARSMLVAAFAAEVINDVNPASLRELLTTVFETFAGAIK